MTYMQQRQAPAVMTTSASGDYNYLQSLYSYQWCCAGGNGAETVLRSQSDSATQGQNHDCTCYPICYVHVFGANFHLVQTSILRPFLALCWLARACKSNAIAKADSNSCLDSQTYDGGSQITAAVLFASSCQPA